MEADLLHEMLHGVFEFLGYKNHDEKRIDELANALHMVILDNPELFLPEKSNKIETQDFSVRIAGTHCSECLLRNRHKPPSHM